MIEIGDLSGLSDFEFEARRCQIIGDYLKSLPPEQSRRARLYQMNLDVQRASMTSQEFMSHCFSTAVENMHNIADQFGMIRTLLGDEPKLSTFQSELRSAYSV